MFSRQRLRGDIFEEFFYRVCLAVKYFGGRPVMHVYHNYRLRLHSGRLGGISCHRGPTVSCHAYQIPWIQGECDVDAGIGWD